MNTIEEAQAVEMGEDDFTLDKLDELRLFIAERWQVFQQSLEQYQWALETARWHELAFCVTARLGEPELDVVTARSLVALAANLGLLRVECLAKLLGERQELNTAAPDAALLLELLDRTGMSPEKAKAVVTALCETALGLQTQYGGKVQRYLRRYGDLMLDELGASFHYNGDGEALRHAFTHWLQNVLNMPLPLSEPAVLDFCQERDLTVDDLVAVADDLDLNLALLDDMIASFEAETAEAVP